MVRNMVFLLEILTFLYGFAAICGRKMRYDIYDVVYIIADMMLLIGIDEQTIPSYLVYLTYVALWIYCMLKYRVSAKKAIVNWGVVFIYVTVIQLICYVPVRYSFGTYSTIKEVLVFLMCFVVMCFFGTKLRMKEISDFLLGNPVVLVIISGFICVGIGTQIWQIKKDGIIDAEDGIPLMYFVILLFIMLYEWQKTRNDAERKRAQLEMNALYYDAYEDLIRSIREKQHEFKNHINAVAGMIYTNDDYGDVIAKQKNYFEEVLGEMEEVSLLTLVENPLLSGFLVRKITEAERKDIRIVRNCIWKSQELKIPEYKLVEMMGILFDNAVEAVEKLKENRSIQVNLNKEEELLVFSVVNVYEGELLSPKIFEAGYSSKGRGRGLGLAKLQRMAEEAGGGIYMEHGWKDAYRTVKLEIRIPV